MGQFDRKGYRPTSKRTAVLSCQHKQEFSPAPEIHDTVYCLSCKEYRQVILLQSDYRARCRQCNYSKKFGRAMWAADQAARKHGDGHSHTVDRYDGSTLEWTYTPGGDGQLTIANAEEPPF